MEQSGRSGPVAAVKLYSSLSAHWQPLWGHHSAYPLDAGCWMVRAVGWQVHSSFCRAGVASSCAMCDRSNIFSNTLKIRPHMTRIILQSTMSCSTFGLYVAYLNHMKRRRWITGDATLAGILTPDLRSSMSKIFDHRNSKCFIFRWFYHKWISNFRAVDFHSTLLQWQCMLCVLQWQCNVLQFNVDISLSLSPTTLWDNIWWQHCKMQSGVHQLFKSSHKPQQMFVLFVISTSTLPSWPSSQVLKLILSQHQSHRPRGLISCVMCIVHVVRPCCIQTRFKLNVWKWLANLLPLREK